VRPFSVVPDEPFHEFLVEEVRVFEVVGMIINELFLDGAIESFAASIHFRGLWIRMVAGEMQSAKGVGKMFLKFRSIVGEDEGERDREYYTTVIKEFLCGGRCVGGCCPREGEAGADIFKGDDIPLKRPQFLSS
jgi:hypothetical protein